MPRVKEIPLFCRSKVWLEDAEGNVVFGLGRLRILEAIQEHGSIHSAAKELKMSYRAMWSRISATEKRLGRQLLEKKIGGKAGGGSRLTPLALELIAQFRKVHRIVANDTDEQFTKNMGNKLDIYVKHKATP